MYNKLLHWSLVLGIVGILLSALGAYCGWFYFPTMIHQKIEEVGETLLKKKKIKKETIKKKKMII